MDKERKKIRAELQNKYWKARLKVSASKVELLIIEQEIKKAGYKVHPHTGRLNKVK